jgi:hypothetical protein
LEVIRELWNNNIKSLVNLIDPSLMHHKTTTNDGGYSSFLYPNEEMLPLSLQVEDWRRLNIY